MDVHVFSTWYLALDDLVEYKVTYSQLELNILCKDSHTELYRPIAAIIGQIATRDTSFGRLSCITDPGSVDPPC